MPFEPGRSQRGPVAAVPATGGDDRSRVCQPVDVPLLLADVSEVCVATADRHGVALRLSSPQRLLAWSDPALLGRLLHGFVIHLLQSTPQGDITLEALRGAGTTAGQVRVRVSVASSSGAPSVGASAGASAGASTGASAVSASWPGSAPRSAEPPGAAGIAQLLGTRITQMQGPDAGFEILLPLAVDSVTVIPAPPLVDARAKPPDRQPLTGCTVLLLDDEQGIRDSLSTFLFTQGCDVRTAADPAEALAHWHGGYRPQVLLVDYRLRGGRSGLDALHDLRAAGCQAQAILITGDTEPGRIAALRAEGLPVIYKPVDGAVLIEALRLAHHGFIQTAKS